jgi:hypothetical protein
MPIRTSNVKTISPGGQISLGKKYAGRQVIVDQLEEGVWMVKTAITIPENELWLHQESTKSRLDAAIKETAQRYANGNTPPATDLDELEAKLLANLEARERKD